LEELNTARKDVAYGDAGFDLMSIDLKDLVGELEAYIDEVNKLLP